MNSHFMIVGEGIEVRFSAGEIAFLSDVPKILAELGDPDLDPGAARLSPPVYLDDPEAEEEWRRLSGSELEASRRADRAAFEAVLEAVSGSIDKSEGEDGVGFTTITRGDADALIRVLNEVRLVLGSRWGIDTAGDYERLRPEASDVISYLGWLVSDLADVLSEALELP